MEEITQVDTPHISPNIEMGAGGEQGLSMNLSKTIWAASIDMSASALAEFLPSPVWLKRKIVSGSQSDACE